MNLFSNWLSKSTSSDASVEGIFNLLIKSPDFIRADVLAIYTKILTDTAERTSGLKENEQDLLWDSCVQTKAKSGLISLLAKAMTDKSDLFLVLKKIGSDTMVLREADVREQSAIRKDYEKNAESKLGVYISFKDYQRTDMLKIFSGFEYCTLASLNKSLNVAKSIQFKFNDMRQSVSSIDKAPAIEQARSMSKAMSEGNDVMMDSKDIIDTAKPDTTAAEKSSEWITHRKAEILAMPFSYIDSEQTAGMGSTGEQDTRAVERGLKQYFVSIIKPTYKAVFKKEDSDIAFKTQDFRNVTTANETLKTFSLSDDELLSKQTKQDITARMYEVDPEEEKKRIEEEKAQREKDAAKNAATLPNPNDPSNPQAGKIGVVNPNQQPNQGTQPSAVA